MAHDIVGFFAIEFSKISSESKFQEILSVLLDFFSGKNLLEILLGANFQKLNCRKAHENVHVHVHVTFIDIPGPLLA